MYRNNYSNNSNYNNNHYNKQYKGNVGYLTANKINKLVKRADDKQYKKKVYQKKAATTATKGSTWKIAISKPPVFPLANQYIRNQLYYEIIPTVGTTSALPQQFFTANSVFDPYSSTGGHSAMGFDEMMRLYNHFCVFRSTISVTFQNSDVAEMVRVGIALFPSNSTYPLQDMLENGLVKSTVLSPVGTGGNVKTLTLDCDVKRYFGRSKYKDLMDDDELCGDVNTDPVEKVYFGIFASNIVGLDTKNVGFDVMISYDTMYFEPRKVNSS